MRRFIHNILIVLFIVSLLAFCGAVFSGCKTIYVPVETLKTEYKDQYLRDSIYLKDSVLIKIKGDTVFLEKYRHLYRDKLIRDSVFIRDSIPYPIEIQIKGDVIYKMRWYEEIGFYIGLLSIFILFIYLFIRR